MQKNYKHYIIKSTANNKRYKLYNKNEPNVEIFMSPYLSDVMAFISIEENELYVTDEFNSMLSRLPDFDKTNPWGEDGVETLWVFPTLQELSKPKPIIKKKPIVKKKVSMKMKKKA